MNQFPVAFTSDLTYRNVTACVVDWQQGGEVVT
jgi:hypothetical protein